MRDKSADKRRAAAPACHRDARPPARPPARWQLLDQFEVAELSLGLVEELLAAGGPASARGSRRSPRSRRRRSGNRTRPASPTALPPASGPVTAADRSADRWAAAAPPCSSPAPPAWHPRTRRRSPRSACRRGRRSLAQRNSTRPAISSASNTSWISIRPRMILQPDVPGWHSRRLRGWYPPPPIAGNHHQE